MAWAEAVDLAGGHSMDCKYLAANAVGRCRGAVVVVAAADVTEGEEGEAGHERERS